MNNTTTQEAKTIQSGLTARQRRKKMTRDELSAGLQTLITLSGVIRELKQVPSGHVYAHVMAYMDINAYEAAIRTLCNAGVIRKSGDTLHWNV